ncbi:MAG: DUF4395 family protein [Alphaproteobacteria bacterium]|jgi:hypothetical protein|nr:DUF4395 family protein [Alphaproteobacteria bacterium]MBT5860180.1 DUF4395 family protein [Alphaproteobacteria bacterium]
MASFDFVRRRLNIQGFRSLGDDAAAQVAPWMRFTPTANVVLVAVGTALGSPLVTGIAALMMAIGALTSAHPFDRLYNSLLSPLLKSPRLPPSPDRRRFVFAVGAVWLGVTASLFQMGFTATGYIFGGIMAVMIVPLATVHFCPISEPMELIFGPARPRRDQD